MTQRFALTDGFLRASLEALGDTAPEIAYGLARFGAPPSRSAPLGFRALVRALAGQQLSVKAAATIFARVEAHLGPEFSPARVMRTRVDTYRRLGLSARKAVAIRGLGQAVHAARLPLDEFHKFSDDEVIEHISALKGFGPWSAKMYLLFSMGRPDIWPVEDLGVRTGLALLLQQTELPTVEETSAFGERYAPHRSSVALLCWHAKNRNSAQR